MDYEKKYNEALERARVDYNNHLEEGYKNYREHLETIFPELRENEDERIKKELIEFIKSLLCNDAFDRYKLVSWITWLEKQKENPKSANSIPSDCVSDAKCEDKSPKHSDSDGTDIRDTPAYWKGWDDAMKQKEQKHPNGCFTCDEYKKGYESGRLNGFTAGYNKAMKEIDQKEQQPAEWSEEDDMLMDELESYILYDKEFNDEQKSWRIKRLKSLRPQPHWKPSEEDEKTISDSCCWLAEYAGYLMDKNYGKASMLMGLTEKLKSLRRGIKDVEL